MTAVTSGRCRIVIISGLERSIETLIFFFGVNQAKQSVISDGICNLPSGSMVAQSAAALSGLSLFVIIWEHYRFLRPSEQTKNILRPTDAASGGYPQYVLQT